MRKKEVRPAEETTNTFAGLAGMQNAAGLAGLQNAAPATDVDPEGDDVMDRGERAYPPDAPDRVYATYAPEVIVKSHGVATEAFVAILLIRELRESNEKLLGRLDNSIIAAQELAQRLEAERAQKEHLGRLLQCARRDLQNGACRHQRMRNALTAAGHSLELASSLMDFSLAGEVSGS